MNQSSGLCMRLRASECAITPITANVCLWDEEPAFARNKVIDHLDVSTYPLLLVISTIGSVLCVLVLGKVRPRTSTCVYLMALAVFDAGFMWGQFLPFLEDNGSVLGLTVSWPIYMQYVFTAARFVVEASGLASDLTLMAFSINRFLAIRSPLKHMTTYNSAKRSRVFIPVVILLSSTLFMPPLTEDFWCRTQARNVRQFCEPVFYAPRVIEILMIFYIYTTQLILPIVIFMIIFLVNSLLMRTLVEIRKSRLKAFGLLPSVQSAKSPHSTASEGSALLMLGTCVLSYFVCNGPGVARCIMEIMDMTCFQPVSEQFRYFSSPVILLLLNINSSLNFVLYCAIDPAFRSAVAKQMRPERNARPSSRM